MAENGYLASLGEVSDTASCTATAGSSVSVSVADTAEEDGGLASLALKVYVAARDNMPLTVFALLYNKPPAQVRHVLAQRTDDDEDLTPLIVAAKNGHHKVIQVLLSNGYEVDIGQTATVNYDGFPIDEASALWCAAGGGHQDAVRVLLEHGASVNQTTKTNSTPLRAACFDGHLEIVQYLISQGADLHISNIYHNTCLMIACYKGHTNIVRYLLEEGANPNDSAHGGTTALHFSAERGFLQICKCLVEFGAEMGLNEFGITPLQVAADNSQADIVEYFMSLDSCQKSECITALELLGASHANNKDTYDIQKCYHYLWLAMQERLSDPEQLPKDVASPVPAYDNHVECTALAELEAIKDNPNALHMEALVIRERILGENNSDIPHPIIFRGAVFADSGRFDRCLALWLRALRLQQKNRRSTAKDLMRFVQVFSQMINLDREVGFCMVHLIFKLLMIELEDDLKRCAGEKLPDVEDFCMCDPDWAYDVLEHNIYCSLYLLDIAQQLKRDKDDELAFCQDVYRYNKLQLTMRTTRNTPLHLVCDEETYVDDFYVNDVVSFPSCSVASLLIKCGADINAVNAEGNTPLHTIVRYNRPISDFLTLHNIILKLLEAGAHPDQTNNARQTAAEYTTTGVAEIILRSHRRISLKCLAARAVRQYNIKYVGQIPHTLEDFVQIH